MREKLGRIVFVVQPQKDGFVWVYSAIEGGHCSCIHLEVERGLDDDATPRRVGHGVTNEHVPLLRDMLSADDENISNVSMECLVDCAKLLSTRDPKDAACSSLRSLQFSANMHPLIGGEGTLQPTVENMTPCYYI